MSDFVNAGKWDGFGRLLLAQSRPFLALREWSASDAEAVIYPERILPKDCYSDSACVQLAFFLPDYSPA